MASPHFIILSLTILPLAIVLATCQHKPPGGVTTDSICASTQYPKFCRSALLPYNSSISIADYGRISLRKSLSRTRKFLKLVGRVRKRAPALYPSSIGPLDDCVFLAQENLDSIQYALQSVDITDNLQPKIAGDVEALLSATLTNLDTCIDGIKGFVVSTRIAGPARNATKLSSVSLNLFDRGWLQHSKEKRILRERKHTFSDLPNGVVDGIPLKMSPWEAKTFEGLTKIRVLHEARSRVDVSSFVVVDRSGRGNFTRIKDAVSYAPSSTFCGTKRSYFIIHVAEGTYNEYVTIPRHKRFIMMIGKGINKTIITGNKSVVDGFTTFNSSTFTVLGQGFVGINMTIRNTAGAIKHQAVALRNSADLSSFYSCSFEGYQDTLYAHSLRQFYRDCEVSGTVDFIFGNAAAVFQNCKLIPRLGLWKQFNSITAQGRLDPHQNTGFSIHNCTIMASKELAASNFSTETYLGRPWKNYSTTVYIGSNLGGFVHPAGWKAWNGSFALSTLYYAEFNNTGPGSNTLSRVAWPGFHVINATEAHKFTLANLIKGNLWLPRTGVDFKVGL